jgi:hypothetical protein
MTDVKQIAHRYIELCNERAPKRRREMLAANSTGDAKYFDPLMSGDGHDGVDALIAGSRKFPDFKFTDQRAQRFWRACPLLLGPRPRWDRARSGARTRCSSQDGRIKGYRIPTGCRRAHDCCDAGCPLKVAGGRRLPKTRAAVWSLKDLRKRL